MKREKKLKKALAKHVISVYSAGISQVVKIGEVKKVQLAIKKDHTIKDQTANLGCV